MKVPEVVKYFTLGMIVILKGLTAIIETDRTPHEVVTWFVQNTVKVEIPIKGMVYDAHTGISEES